MRWATVLSSLGTLCVSRALLYSQVAANMLVHHPRLAPSAASFVALEIGLIQECVTYTTGIDGLFTVRAAAVARDRLPLLSLSKPAGRRLVVWLLWFWVTTLSLAIVNYGHYFYKRR